MENMLHEVAREESRRLISPDKKQLKFNEIVHCAMTFYTGNETSGVRELVRSCDKVDQSYVAKKPMWAVLRDQYAWMLDDAA